MRRPSRSVAITSAAALALAVWIGLSGLGGSVHVYLIGLLWSVATLAALLVVVVGWVRKRRLWPVAALIVAAGAVQLVSIPIAMAHYDWRAAEARRWCERVAPRWAPRPPAQRDSLAAADPTRPHFAMYVGGTCTWTDPNGWFAPFHEYDPGTGTWTERDAF